MKRSRSPSGNGPDHLKPPRKHTEYKSDRRKLSAPHQNPSSAAKFMPFSAACWISKLSTVQGSALAASVHACMAGNANTASM